MSKGSNFALQLLEAFECISHEMQEHDKQLEWRSARLLTPVSEVWSELPVFHSSALKEEHTNSVSEHTNNMTCCVSYCVFGLC